MRCDKCRSSAVIFQPYSGLHLCEQHFVADVEAKAKRAIRTHRWMTKNDHIAVALSGRTDSSALLYFLTMLTSGRPDITLSAITIDEGIQKYSDPARAENIAKSLGVNCVVASFRGEYGAGMDEIAVRLKDAGSCSYCGVLRRFLLNRIAREQGVTKLAMGVNLDDEAQSVLLHMLRGETEHFLRPERGVAGTVPQIRPFMYIPEREVGLYASLHLNEFGEGCYPYADNALRADVRTLLNDYTLRHPSTKHSLVKIANRITDTIGVGCAGIRTCERCGEPGGGICQTCRIIGEVRGGAT